MQRHYFANKGLYSQSYGFSTSHAWMGDLDHKAAWVPKDWYFWTVVLEKTLENPLNCKEIKPVNSKGKQPWIFIGRTDAEAPTLWPTDAKNWPIGKDPDDGKDWRQEEKGMGMTEDEMVGFHHWLNGHEFKQTLGDGEGLGSLVCCSPWGHKETWLTTRDLIWAQTLSERMTQVLFYLVTSRQRQKPLLPGHEYQQLDLYPSPWCWAR